MYEYSYGYYNYYVCTYMWHDIQSISTKINAINAYTEKVAV